MTIELKIKNKHLSEEAKIIRFEERKLKKHAQHVRERQGSITADGIMKQFRSLNHHRRWDVRNENRATYLARAFIAGIPYSQVEQKRKEENEYKFLQLVLPRVLTMVNKYGRVFDPIERKWPPEFTKEQILEWTKI